MLVECSNCIYVEVCDGVECELIEKFNDKNRFKIPKVGSTNRNREIVENKKTKLRERKRARSTKFNVLD